MPNPSQSHTFLHWPVFVMVLLGSICLHHGPLLRRRLVKEQFCFLNSDFHLEACASSWPTQTPSHGTGLHFLQSDFWVQLSLICSYFDIACSLHDSYDLDLIIEWACLRYSVTYFITTNGSVTVPLLPLLLAVMFLGMIKLLDSSYQELSTRGNFVSTW